jgi:long-chain acyl-CoA synthetase
MASGRRAASGFLFGRRAVSRKLIKRFLGGGHSGSQGSGIPKPASRAQSPGRQQSRLNRKARFEGIEMRVAESDGEILVRGKNVMRGYYNNAEETAKVIDEEGFYHTGDVGYVDEDGHFFITDRKKDLFKLSNGKYVAPQQVESLLKQSPLVSQAVAVGSGRKQVGALICAGLGNAQTNIEGRRNFRRRYARRNVRKPARY